MNIGGGGGEEEAMRHEEEKNILHPSHYVCPFWGVPTFEGDMH